MIGAFLLYTPSILVLEVVLAFAQNESKEVVLACEALDAAAPRNSAPAPHVRFPGHINRPPVVFLSQPHTTHAVAPHAKST